MDKLSDKDVNWLLQPNADFERFLGNRAADYVPKPEIQNRKFSFTKVVLFLLMGIFSLIFPFFLLIRSSVYMVQVQQWNGWLALGIGAAASMVFIGLIFMILFRRTRYKRQVYRIGLSFVVIMVLGFCSYGLMYLSGVNAKTDDIREVYRSLHPILRVAVATTTLADNELIITDIKRTPEDYRKMGLTPRQSSLHYEQETGFVHAIDLRTIGHSEMRNKSLEYSLRIMGFQTIRHVGTADHLHVALPLN